MLNGNWDGKDRFDGGFCLLASIQARSSMLKIYVGNLSRHITEDELRQEFEAFERVDSAAVIRDCLSPRLSWVGFARRVRRSRSRY